MQNKTSTSSQDVLLGTKYTLLLEIDNKVLRERFSIHWVSGNKERDLSETGTKWDDPCGFLNFLPWESFQGVVKRGRIYIEFGGLHMQKMWNSESRETKAVRVRRREMHRQRTCWYVEFPLWVFRRELNLRLEWQVPSVHRELGKVLLTPARLENPIIHRALAGVCRKSHFSSGE